jgi:NADPH:quinone reductase-like Zn-dependent oxidoreductase
MPAKLLFEEAASVPLCGLTAQQCLAGKPEIGPESAVVIHAAAGGVGHLAVQLAKLAGARVLATGSGASHPFLLGLGADVAVDYNGEDFRDAVRRHCPAGADLVLDAVGGDTLARSYDLLRPGGRLVSIVEEPDPRAAQERGSTARFLGVEPDGEGLERLTQLFDRKKLRTRVQRIYALSEAAAAHETAEQGHVKGKLVLNL